MKVWKYKEMRDKVILDLGLQDEQFVTPTELVGYFNEALTEAESELIELNQDYFLTKYSMPLVVGQGRYDLPANIYANKIRGIMYQNGSVIYPVVRYRRRYDFQNIAFTDTYGTSDDYRYIPVNDIPGQAQLDLHPVARETATPDFQPMIMWYIRNCVRVPLLGEFCNPEYLTPAKVNILPDQITVAAGTLPSGRWVQGIVGGYPGSIPYVTGDAVQLNAAYSTSTAPGNLVFGTTYYVIVVTPTTIKLASSLANAIAGTAITLSSNGTVGFFLTVSATQPIIDASLIDIPEFATFVMQWVKCRCMEKEGDPRLEGASAVLVQQKKQMVDSLTNAIPDDDDEIVPDFSHYQEMS